MTSSRSKARNFWIRALVTSFGARMCAVVIRGRSHSLFLAVNLDPPTNTYLTAFPACLFNSLLDEWKTETCIWLQPPAANVSISHQQFSPRCPNRRRLLANLRPLQPRSATKKSTTKGVRRRLHTEQLREQRLIVSCP